jgi:hypothetical protein
MNHLLVTVLLCLYEGDFNRAATLLEPIRARNAIAAERFRQGLPTVIFLQGGAARIGQRLAPASRPSFRGPHRTRFTAR